MFRGHGIQSRWTMKSMDEILEIRVLLVEPDRHWSHRFGQEKQPSHRDNDEDEAARAAPFEYAHTLPFSALMAIERPQVAAMSRTGSLDSSRLAIALVLALLDISPAIREARDTSEVATELRWRIVDEIALIEVIAPGVAIGVRAGGCVGAGA